MADNFITRRLVVKHMIAAFAVMLPALPAALNAADLKLSAVFSNHMVLQRDKPVPVWGWGDPGEQITVEFSGRKQAVKADAAGKWMVKLAPMKANKGQGSGVRYQSFKVTIIGLTVSGAGWKVGHGEAVEIRVCGRGLSCNGPRV